MNLGKKAVFYSGYKYQTEILLTFSNYVYPPPTMVVEESLDEILNQDRQMAEVEKQRILEFEVYLAAATTKKTITVDTSLLISQLTTMDPT